MTKPFNIHDWQAKQRLSEQRADWTPPPMGMGPGDKNTGLEAEIEKYIGQTFASWMSPDNPPFAQEYAKPPYIDKLMGGIMDIINSGDIDNEDENNDMNLAQDDSRDYNSERDFLPLQEHTVTFTKDDMATLHNDGELVKADDDGKDHTYIFGGDLDEQNTTGGGTTISTGNSPAIATPYAFKKKKKK